MSMSSQTSNKKSERQKNAPGVPAGILFGKKQASKPKLRLDTIDDIELAPSSALPGAFKVIVALPGRSRQYTIHHPVGVTPLQDDEWVITPTGDIPDLLSRRVNVEEKKRAELVTKRFQESAIDQKLGNLVNGQFLPRSGLSMAKMREMIHNPPKGMDPELRVLYKKLVKRLEDLRKNTDSSVAPAPPYETKSGPLQDRQQIPVKGLAGKEPGYVADVIIEHIFRLAKDEGPPLVNPAAAPAPEVKIREPNPPTVEDLRQILGDDEDPPSDVENSHADDDDESESSNHDPFSPDFLDNKDQGVKPRPHTHTKWGEREDDENKSRRQGKPERGKLAGKGRGGYSTKTRSAVETVGNPTGATVSAPSLAIASADAEPPKEKSDGGTTQLF